MSLLVIAPHPDDETVGAGGLLLRARDESTPIHWLVVTSTKDSPLYGEADYERREGVVDAVARELRFDSVHKLGLPTTRLDELPLGDIVGAIASVVRELQPRELLLPFPGDVHSDHRVVFDAASACTKWFRFPSVKRVLCYEVISETEFGVDPTRARFQPNVFVDISAQLEEKLRIAKLYESELAAFPFPRSVEAIRALAQFRGSTSGCQAAEAFMLLREIR